MRARRRVATAWAAAATVVIVGCAGSQAPWDVEADQRDRFQETSRVCRLLTDDSSGSPVPESFDRCMKRRGWKRQGPIKRLFSGD
jgi:hypothetical protein